MTVLSIPQSNEGAVAAEQNPAELDTTSSFKGMKYQRTLLFAMTALFVMGIATIVAATAVNNTVAILAETQLVDLVEEITASEARHILSMITGGMVMPGMNVGPDKSPEMIMDSGDSTMMNQDQPMSGDSMKMDQVRQMSGEPMTMNQDPLMSMESAPLTLEMLIGPTGLPAQIDGLVSGLGVVSTSLYSPVGEILWSTDSSALDQPNTTTQGMELAIAGTLSSVLVENREFIEQDGSVIVMDVVETFVPLRDSMASPVVGVLEINRKVGTELGTLVDDTKSTVVWTTVATMAALFVALVGFVVVSDRMIYRSDQRELSLVKDRISELNRANEEAERARSLESHNQELELLTSQLIESQNQVARNEKLATIGKMSAGIAHDLRNPMGSIQNCAYMLNKELSAEGAIDANPKLKRYLEMIDNQIVRSNGTITDLMTFANPGEIELVETHLDEVLKETLETIIKDDKITILEHYEPGLHPVMGASSQLQRIFQNLINNAQESMPDGGQLTITARNKGDVVEIAFADTGIGISEEVVEKIFDPLFTTKVKGTGLGLAVCEQIVERHGGTINVKPNEIPPGGSTFEVILSAANVEPQS